MFEVCCQGKVISVVGEGKQVDDGAVDAGKATPERSLVVGNVVVCGTVNSGDDKFFVTRVSDDVALLGEGRFVGVAEVVEEGDEGAVDSAGLFLRRRRRLGNTAVREEGVEGKVVLSINDRCKDVEVGKFF